MHITENHYQKNYFLNHSVGLPFPGSQAYFQKQFFDNWQQQTEPWHGWIEAIENFRAKVATLINSEPRLICPQTNLSSGLTKIIYSLPKPNKDKNIILCSEDDFPSMAFVLEKAQALGYQLKFITKDEEVLDLNTWQQHLNSNIAIALITHAQSNNGKQLPVTDICQLCREQEVISIVDVAQSIGVLEVNVKKWQPDFILGSCVKWLCGGPGAGFLWVSGERLNQCSPVDVGWFSHENPFEFDIHHFSYHDSALKFWGGTPSVASYVLAGHAIGEVLKLEISEIRAINCAQQQQIRDTIAPEFLISPKKLNQSSGTIIAHFGKYQEQIAKQLTQAGICFDQRQQGIRLSPHFYTNDEDITNLVKALAL
jgi:selenocysteine lyase/cysteine desulfurase